MKKGIHIQSITADSSLKRNLPYLFAFEQNRESGIPTKRQIWQTEDPKTLPFELSDETERLFIDNFSGV